MQTFNLKTKHGKAVVSFFLLFVFFELIASSMTHYIPGVSVGFGLLYIGIMLVEEKRKSKGISLVIALICLACLIQWLVDIRTLQYLIAGPLIIFFAATGIHGVSIGYGDYWGAYEDTTLD